MELTIDQALQQGVTAHNRGDLQGAERLYRAILQFQPKHPDANHNLGLLFASAGKPADALPMLKVALEGNPKNAQFWLSYAEALTAASHFSIAKQVLEEAERAGILTERLAMLREQINDARKEVKHSAEKELPRYDKRRRLAEKKKGKRRQSEKEKSLFGPSKEQINELIEHYQGHRLDEAEALATWFTTEFPEHELGWKVLGAVLKQTGRLNQSLRAMRKSVKLAPEDPEAHNNLGVTLQNLIRLDEAEASLRKAISIKPDFAEAHTNLGNTLRERGRLDAAADSYRRAISFAPKYAEAHYNLGNTLRELGRPGDAEASLRQAVRLRPDFAEAHCNLGQVLVQLGRLQEAEESLGCFISLQPTSPDAQNNLGALLQQAGRLEEAEDRYRQAITLKPSYADSHNKLGVLLQQLGRLDEAVQSYKRAIALNSDFVDAHVHLGVALKDLGRLHEAEQSLRHAILLEPKYANSHNNLGVLLNELGRLHEAEKALRLALELRSDFHEAHDNLGVTLRKMGRLNEAEQSCRTAISLAPEYANAHNNLSVVLQDLGRFGEAVTACARAVALNPEFAGAKANLGIVLKGAKFSSSEPWLYAPLETLLTTGNFVQPRDVGASIVSLLKQEPLLQARWLHGSIPAGIDEVMSLVEVFHNLPLIHHFMRICSIPDADFERTFTSMRKILLAERHKLNESHELICFLSTLALHCFINEYVYYVSDEETQLVNELGSSIESTIAAAEQPNLIHLLCFASYRPLHLCGWIKGLEVLDQYPELQTRLIEEPLSEKEISLGIPSIKEISDVISRKVRQQYEENPYPRWVKLGLPVKSGSVADLCEHLELKVQNSNITSVSSPNILVAGCGTGQHSIGTAARFTESKVTAIDLSLASLGYAKRKTEELGLSNLEYFHGDILDLRLLNKKFDIVECSGVLHHMEDPVAGWKVLTDMLRPGGLMKIALYSELARQPVVEARDQIALLKIGDSDPEIRKFRRYLMNSPLTAHRALTTFTDFYSLSEIRDLIFHVNEHRFTLSDIEEILNSLHLSFCGFEDPDLKAKFKKWCGTGADIYNLEMWDQFENDNPTIFIGMYQFWCQKIQ